MGFLAPGLLWLTGLAAIPVVIHLLSRLRLQRAPFPSLALLATVRRERFSWLRLKEILLLVFRTLALAALLFALARPYIRHRMRGLDRANDLVIVLDDSYSMAYSDRWQKAQSAARELLKELGVGRRAMILLASEWNAPAEFVSARRLLNRIDSLTPSFSAVTLESVISRADREAHPTQADVVVITDLQERAVSNLGWPRRDMSQLPDKSARLPNQPRLAFVNVAESEFDNAGITRLYPVDRYPAAGRPVRLKVDVINHGRTAVTRTLVLTVGTQQEEKVIELKPQQLTTVEFETALPDSGMPTAQVELRTDSLTADNIRWLAVARPSNSAVLIVESPQVPARYLVDALGPESLSGLRLTVVGATELGRHDTRKYAVVVLTDAAALSRSDRSRLDFHVQSGRAVLIMAGVSPPDTVAICGIRFHASQGAGFASVAEVDSSHPVLQVLHAADLTAARFYRHTLLDLPAGRVLVRGSDETPLVVETNDGRVVVWAFAPAPEFTDLVHKAAFVPLLHRTLRYLLTAPLVTEYNVQDTIRVGVEVGSPVPVSWPGGRTSVEPIVRTGRPVAVVTDTRLPGLYQVGEHTLAVNTDPAEGDLTQARLDAARLAAPTTQDLVPVLLLVAACAFAAELLLLL